jgi:hypothetical protein
MGTMSQQEQQPQQPTGSSLCTMLMGDDRQADALGTDSTAYGRMNDATTLDAGASSTSAQAVLFSAGGMPSPNVVGPIPSRVVMDLTSTSSTTLGSALGMASASTTSNDASHDRDIPPATSTAPHPTRTTVTPTMMAWADIECFQKRPEASKLRRQEYGDPQYGPDGHPPPPPPPPPARPPPQAPPLPDDSCSSSSPTSTSRSQAASTSSSAPFDENPSLSLVSKLGWVHCAGISALVFGSCIYRMLRSRNACPSTSVLPTGSCSNDVGSLPAMPPFTGSGRTCGSMSRYWCFKLPMKWWRNVAIAYASARFVASVKRTEEPMDDSASVSESKTPVDL